MSSTPTALLRKGSFSAVQLRFPQSCSSLPSLLHSLLFCRTCSVHGQPRDQLISHIHPPSPSLWLTDACLHQSCSSTLFLNMLRLEMTRLNHVPSLGLAIALLSALQQRGPARLADVWTQKKLGDTMPFLEMGKGSGCTSECCGIRGLYRHWHSGALPADLEHHAQAIPASSNHHLQCHGHCAGDGHWPGDALQHVAFIPG